MINPSYVDGLELRIRELQKQLNDASNEALHLIAENKSLNTERDALTDSYRHELDKVSERNYQLRFENGVLAAQVESVKSAIRAVQAVPRRSGFTVNAPNPKAEFVAWARLNEVMSASPAQCLREIQAEAGRAGFIYVSQYDFNRMDDDEINTMANEYADKVRQGSE